MFAKHPMSFAGQGEHSILWSKLPKLPQAQAQIAKGFLDIKI
jgi:hypothetical protein